MKLSTFSCVAILCALACGDSSNSASPTAPSQAGAFAAALESSDPAPPAPPSVIDPFDPWSALGPLSGNYSLRVERLDHDCAYGPDLPLPERYGIPELDLNPPLESEETRRVTVVQRGNGLAFTIGEGAVFANWDADNSRLLDVERVGAEGITLYHDGFDVVLNEDGADGVVISGVSEWTFEGDYYMPGEVCSGLTRWTARRVGGPPRSGTRDLQVVLRWPATSGADLDLMVTPPQSSSFSTLNNVQIDLVDSAMDCFVLESTATTGSPNALGLAPFDGLVDDLDDTDLPYHEEVIRCRTAPWGGWKFTVLNWSSLESVDFDIEVFWGPHVNTVRSGERSFGVLSGALAPLSREDTDFHLIQPTLPGDDAGARIIISTVGNDQFARRPFGPVSRSRLEFHKSALEGISYADFLTHIGF